jgi:hemoglobin/transferrin/lactoferrin receptor protein
VNFIVLILELAKYMIKKISIVLCISIIFPISGYAEQEKSLVVVNEISGEPISGARIFFSDKSAITNSNGRVFFDLPDDGVLIIEHPGYQRLQINLRELHGQDLVIRLQPRVFSETITITGATKRNQNIVDSSKKVEQIDKASIDLENPQTSADLITSAQGVYVQKSQMGGGSPMIRGFSTNRILIVVDGVRMNNAIFRSGNVHNVISLDPNIIESTEVVYGPGSNIYGSDAIGGVISFSSLLPQFSEDGMQYSGSVFYRTSTANDEQNGHLQAGLASEKFSLLVSTTLTGYGDLRMGSSGFPEYQRFDYVKAGPSVDQVVSNDDTNLQRFTGYDQRNYSARLGWQISDSLLFNAGFLDSETTDIPRYDRLIEQTADGQPRSAQWYYGPQKWRVGWARLEYERDTPLFSSLRVQLSGQRFKESRHDRRLFRSELRNRFEEVESVALNIDANRYLGEKIDLYYGLEIIADDVSSTAFSKDILTGLNLPLSTRYPDGSTWSSRAIYASGVFRISDRLTMTAAARYTNVEISGRLDKTFFQFPFDSIDLKTSAITGSLGFTYSLNNDTLIFLNAGSGFRAPNVDDVAKVFDSEPGSVVVPNPELEAEKAYSADLGILRLLANGGQVRFNAFYTRLVDAMVRRDWQFNGQTMIEYDGVLSRVQAIVNAEEASVSGLEFGFTMPVYDHFQLKGSLNLMSGETESGDRLRHVAPTFGSLQMLYERGPWLASASAIYNGEVSASELPLSEQGKPHIYALDEAGNPYSPSWLRFDLKSSYRISAATSIYLGLENVFDRRYRPYSSGVVAPGRNFFAGFRQTF